MRDAKVVGLTAGASAPEELVQGVVDALRALGATDVTELPGLDENVEFRLPAELLQARSRRAAA